MKRDAIRKAQGQRLKEAREPHYRSAREAALDNGWPESSYRAHENGTRTIGQDDAERYAKRFGIKAEFILFASTTPPRKPYWPNVGDHTNSSDDVPAIRELDFRLGAGAGGVGFEDNTIHGEIIVPDEAVRGEWGIPAHYIRGELHVDPRRAWIFEVFGDSGYDPGNPGAPGSLFPGDRVIVDTGDRRPSPPGPFAIHDGIGVVVKLVEVVPNTEMVRLSSRNPTYKAYEVTNEEARIIGRIRGRISAM